MQKLLKNDIGSKVNPEKRKITASRELQVASTTCFLEKTFKQKGKFPKNFYLIFLSYFYVTIQPTQNQLIDVDFDSTAKYDY